MRHGGKEFSGVLTLLVLLFTTVRDLVTILESFEEPVERALAFCVISHSLADELNRLLETLADNFSLLAAESCYNQLGRIGNDYWRFLLLRLLLLLIFVISLLLFIVDGDLLELLSVLGPLEECVDRVLVLDNSSLPKSESAANDIVILNHELLVAKMQAQDLE